MNRALPTALTAFLLLTTACAVAPAAQQTPNAAGSVTCTYRTSNQPAKPVDPPSGSNVPATGTTAVTLNFAAGAVQVTLDRASAPCTVHSFESLAQQGFYNASPCHRMSTGGGYFFLQCGDPSGTGRGGPGYWFDDELANTKSYPKGTVAMANSGRNTNGSQFFIVYEDAKFSPNYTVFGHIDDKGLAVIAAIGAKGTDGSESPNAGRPLGDATIKSVSIG